MEYKYTKNELTNDINKLIDKYKYQYDCKITLYSLVAVWSKHKNNNIKEFLNFPVYDTTLEKLILLEDIKKFTQFDESVLSVDIPITEYTDDEFADDTVIDSVFPKSITEYANDAPDVSITLIDHDAIEECAAELEHVSHTLIEYVAIDASIACDTAKSLSVSHKDTDAYLYASEVSNYAMNTTSDVESAIIYLIATYLYLKI